MQRIDIKLTFKCNNYCKFCVQGNKRVTQVEKKINVFKRILKESRSVYGMAVFTGGEPTLRKDIVELVIYAKELGYRVQMQTNGRMFFYKKFCKDVVRAGVDDFAISIQAHEARLHDYLTSVNGSFEQTVSGIKNLLSFDKLVATNTVITKLNYTFLPEIAKYLIKLGINQYQFSFPHILGKAFENRSWLVPRKNEIVAYLKKGLDVGIRMRKKVNVEAIPYCFLYGYENYLSDRYIPETKVFDITVIKNFNRWRKKEGKLKGPKCKDCKYFSCCEGPWREYPRLYGWKEFQPIKK